MAVCLKYDTLHQLSACRKGKIPTVLTDRIPIESAQLNTTRDYISLLESATTTHLNKNTP